MQIKCYTATLKQGIAAPTTLTLNGQSVESYFATGSWQGGAAAIDLRFDHSRRTRGQIPDAVRTDGRWLENQMRAVLPDPQRVGRGVDEIALIFADFWVNPDWMFGLMFDVGFDPTPGSAPVTAGRRGAALFLGEIYRRRGEAGYQDEDAFTAIHELGHVFNLWHTGRPANQRPASLLTASSQAGLHPPAAYHFEDQPADGPAGTTYLGQQEFLSRCESSEFVQPGGSRFGSRGPLGPAERVSLNRATENDRIELRVAAARREFWRFEPVKLDIILALTSKQQTKAWVPDELDPAFDRFDLWITEPDGTRRTYRSPIYLCPAPQRRQRIAHDEPFARDLPLFGQSGGYTFSVAGEHTLQAVFQLSSRRRIVSNELKVNILPAGRKVQYATLRDALCDREAARLLFYGSGGRGAAQSVTRLEELAANQRQHPVAGEVHYGLGQAMLRAAHGSKHRDRAAAIKLAAAAREHFASAAQHKSVSPLRRRRAAQYRSEAVELASPPKTTG